MAWNAKKLIRFATMRLVEVVVTVLLLAAVGRASGVRRIRRMAAAGNTTCFLVFGDSTVDPGNNNAFLMAMKSNFPPYGKDFFDGQPTGRFCNGRLATDFIAEAFGFTNVVKGYLDRTMTQSDLLRAVSFASAGSGYDQLTTTYTNALPVSKQIEYFNRYKIDLRQFVGDAEAEKMVENAIVLISMGTNDFLQNYYLQPVRSRQFSLEEYQNYLISSMSGTIKALQRMGVRQLAVAGVPPFGCVPIVRTFSDDAKCNDDYNEAAISFNSKIKLNLASLGASLGIKTCYIDIYTIVAEAIQEPHKYGFEETSKGCCGSGLIEYGDTCRGMTTCSDRTKYLFWDAIHPTERMYQIVACEAVNAIAEKFMK